MGQLLQFKPREMPASSTPRTLADDDHDAALWMDAAEAWGWSAKEFMAPDHDLSGYILFHTAAGDQVPLYTLIRSPAGWRSWDKQRQLTEYETFHEALQAVFPTALIARHV